VAGVSRPVGQGESMVSLTIESSLRLEKWLSSPTRAQPDPLRH
jgi:hypothetical protein